MNGEFMGWLGLALWIVFFVAVGIDVAAKQREHKLRAQRRAPKIGYPRSVGDE